MRAIGPDPAQNAPKDTASAEVEMPSHEALDLADAVEMESDLDLAEYDLDEEHLAVQSRFDWVAPTIAVTLIVAWTTLYGWAMQSQLLGAANAAPSEWVRWIIDWSVPVLLVGVGWILSMRHSRAEAKRFAETASLLSQESVELENRLTVVNRELSLARDFLGAQSRELDSFGRIASERISAHASELQQLIQDNGSQVEAIGSASETALGNMKRLRDDLPVVANSARDVSNQVGNTGRTALEQVEKLVAGFERLNDFGKASETQVSKLDEQIRGSLSDYEVNLARVSQVLGTRIAELQSEAGSYRSEVEVAESAALSALKDRMAMLQSETKAIAGKLREAEIQALEQLDQSRSTFESNVIKSLENVHELDRKAHANYREQVKAVTEEAARFDEHLAIRDQAFMEKMTQRQEEFDTREAQASEVLAQRLADIDDALTERREAQATETEKLVSYGATMTDQLDALSVLIGEIGEQSSKAQDGLNSGLSNLGDQLAKKREEITAAEAQLADLTESGIRLLEIIQSGARHSRDELPVAIGTATEALESVEQRTASLAGMMLTTNEKAEGLDNYLVETQAKIERADQSIETLQARLAEQSEDALARLQGLRGGFARLTEQSDTFAGETQEKLREALETLEHATQSAYSALEEGTRERVGSLGEKLSKEAMVEMEKALNANMSASIGAIETAASQASSVGRDTTAQLRDQLAKVNELTANLEQRIARSRELAEEEVGNDFARRMALITDSLNSNAIDITSALSTDVTDTAWDSYLKGDRGIFTRRAVRLLENGDAKEIAELYQSDDAFKGNVNRFIHDFEAMLRSMLSTRDGNALSVTILGSDMGKLYVALAQSIERLRQ